ncbi:extracellular solute-binding protein [uncultured Pseudokineococcus sp.]|uniref:sugar ABC transporter substrate-binding protein n=1 Tax=uncultured Pseudokineococcus sp. TaxID=1642928 RepID=UPI00263448D2|nr:extracellular solute-binding protein [uncultured Pseudokineococcus sp.]
MRISLRAAVAAVGIAALTAGCGGGSSAPAETDAAPAEPDAAATTGAPARDDADLVVWTDELKIGAVTEIAEQFGEDNGISVAVQAVTDLQANFVTANAATNGPDVVVGAHDWIGNMVQNGAIDPLQITADQLGQYSEVAVDAVTYDEQLYGLPYGVEALVLYRNTDLVPEAPATLDEAFATGLELKEAGTVESAFNLPVGELGDAYHMQPLYTSLGGYVFGQDPAGGYDPTDLGVGDEASQAAGERIEELGEGGSGVLTRSVSGDNSIALFADGQAPYLLSGPWARADVEAAGFGWDVQAVPGFEGAEPAQPFTGVQAFYVASNGANKAFAQEFVGGAVNTEEAMKTMYDGADIPPSLVSLQESEVAADPQLQAYLDAASAGQPMPSIPQMGSVFEPLGQAYSAIIGGADGAETMVATGETIRTAIS